MATIKIGNKLKLQNLKEFEARNRQTLGGWKHVYHVLKAGQFLMEIGVYLPF